MGVYKNNINNYSYVHDYSSYAYFLHLDELDESPVPPMAKKISKKHDNVNNVSFKVPCTVQVINITTNEWFREKVLLGYLPYPAHCCLVLLSCITAFTVLKVT